MMFQEVILYSWTQCGGHSGRMARARARARHDGAKGKQARRTTNKPSKLSVIRVIIKIPFGEQYCSKYTGKQETAQTQEKARAQRHTVRLSQSQNDVETLLMRG